MKMWANHREIRYYMQKPIAIFFCLLCLCLVPVTSVKAQPASNVDKLDYSTPSTYEIGGITISGTEYLDEGVLLSHAGLVVGDPINIPGEEIPAAIKNLWKLGLFSDVEVNATKIINDVIFLDIAVTERARMSKFALKGVKKADADDIRERIKLYTGRILDENLLNNTRNTVLDYYHDKGYYSAEVDFDTREDEKKENYVILDVKVDRGSRIRINEINIEGNEHVFDHKLKKSMKETVQKTKVNYKAPKMIFNDLKNTNIPHALGNVSWAAAMNYLDDKFKLRIFNSSKFQEDPYEADKEMLIAYYNSLGYRDARIIQDTVYFVDERNVNIDMTIDEGTQYHFGDIVWRGNQKYSDDTLTNILKIQRGDIYNQELLQTRLFMDPAQNDISTLYMDDGYLFFQVNPIETRVDNDTIDLEMRIYEGPQATINNIIIRGNDRTNEHVIRRELFSLPGSKFRRSDLIRSQQQIAGLGYFDPEGIGINPIPNPADGTVDIEYTVAERPSDQLELSAGWGGRSVIGSIGVTFNNFALGGLFKRSAWDPIPQGNGQRLSVRFQTYGPGYLSLNASFTEPWLGGKRPNSLTVSTSRTRLSNQNFRGDIPAGQDKQLLNISSVAVGLGRRLSWPDNFFVLNNTVSYQRYKMENYPNFIYDNGQSNIISLTTTLSRYSLDSPIYPRSGSNFVASLQLTPPWSQFNDINYYEATDDEKYKLAEFHKWKFKAEWYTPLDRARKLVMMASVKMGLMGYYNAGIGHTPFERFRLGGDGFSNTGTGGFLLGEEIIALRGYDELGTSQPYFNKFTLELRYPLSLNPSSTIYTLAFLQAGDSFAKFRDFTPYELNRAAGMGFRIFLPMFGTLGFDYGVGFDKNGDQNQRFWDYLSSFGKFSIVLGVEPE